MLHATAMIRRFFTTPAHWPGLALTAVLAGIVLITVLAFRAGDWAPAGMPTTEGSR